MSIQNLTVRSTRERGGRALLAVKVWKFCALASFGEAVKRTLVHDILICSSSLSDVCLLPVQLVPERMYMHYSTVPARLHEMAVRSKARKPYLGIRYPRCFSCRKFSCLAKKILPLFISEFFPPSPAMSSHSVRPSYSSSVRTALARCLC